MVKYCEYCDKLLSSNKEVAIVVFYNEKNVIGYHEDCFKLVSDEEFFLKVTQPSII